MAMEIPSKRIMAFSWQLLWRWRIDTGWGTLCTVSSIKLLHVDILCLLFMQSIWKQQIHSMWGSRKKLLFSRRLEWTREFARAIKVTRIENLGKFDTGGCRLSQEKAVKDVKSCVQFCFLVGLILDLDWPRKNWPIKIKHNPD